MVYGMYDVPYIVYGIRYVRRTVHCIWYTVCTTYRILYMVYGMYDVPYIVYGIRYAYDVPCIVSGIRYVYDVPYIVYGTRFLEAFRMQEKYGYISVAPPYGFDQLIPSALLLDVDFLIGNEGQDVEYRVFVQFLCNFHSYRRFEIPF